VKYSIVNHEGQPIMGDDARFLDQLSDYPNDRDFRLKYAQRLQSAGEHARADYMRHRAKMMLLPVSSHRYCRHAMDAAELEASLDDAWLARVRDDDLSVYELEQLECMPCWTGAVAARPAGLSVIPVTESLSACFMLTGVQGRKERRPFYMRPDDERFVTMSRLARWNMSLERLATSTVWIHPDDFWFEASGQEADGCRLYQMYTPSDPGWWIHAFFTCRHDWEHMEDREGQKLNLHGQPLLMILDGEWALLTSEHDDIGQARMAKAAAEILDGAKPLTLRPLRLEPNRATPPWQYLPDVENVAAEAWERLFGPEPPPIAPSGFNEAWELLDDSAERAAARSVISHYLPRRRVEVLRFRGSEVTSNLPAVGSFPHLVDLRLSEAEVTKADWKTIESCPSRSLTSLSLTRCRYDNESLEALSRFPRLRRICVEQSSLNDHGLSILASLPSLEELDVQKTNVTDAGIEHLRRTDVGYLTLRGCRVTDAALAALGEISQLKYLPLEGTPVTNDGIWNLQGLDRLSVLGLANTRIDDDVVFTLSRIKSLRRVSGLSSQASVFLMDELPGCHVQSHFQDRFS
jgi:uncharacterized protein (TIGR02996 family)